MAIQLASSSLPPSWTYDVFLSFRGEDTRFTFTDHLYEALNRNGIDTFIDRHLKRGEEISPAFLKAIEESRVSVIVISENYASSRWCLDELVHILECRRSRQQIVWPVFYKVDPSHVRNQTSRFADAFTGHECKYKDEEKILLWRSALKEVANLSGHTVKEEEYEATFISQIVNEILVLVLQRPHLNVAKYQVGMESCVEKVKELLDVGGNDPCVVGIWGASGIGKTEVAKTVYNAIAYKFEGSCFLAMQYGGLLQLQNTLLSEIGGSEWKVVNPHRANSLIEKLLRRKKILLILDDVDELEQLNNLVQVEWLGEGSRVIITTKDRGLLNSYDVELIYEVQKLEDNKALELLSWKAFGKKEPSDDYLGLAQSAIAYAQGHPLALNLIGSYLRNKSIDRWQAILDNYDSYDREPYGGIQKILRKSYDTLDYVMQQVFLDIACFFKGERKDYVLQILRSSKLNVPQDCIDVLVEKAIITVEDNSILMHDLLEKMGKRIVREESPIEPGERSRLWHHEDVYHVLTENRGTKKIKGIVVKLPKLDVIPLNAKSFFKMVNLEIFISRNAHFSGCIEYLPDDLRWIEFGGVKLQDWGSNILQKHILTFNLQSNCHLRHLVAFIMPNSGIKQLKGFENLAMLTSLNLSGSEFLEKIPNLSGNPNLRELILDKCERLVEVDDSVGFLDKLVTLSFDGCSRLKRFATRLGLRSLQSLVLQGCTRLESFPEIEPEMESLGYLDINDSGIRELPSSIAYLTRLVHLRARYCKNLTSTSLRHIFGLQHLSYIEMDECPKLVTFGKFSTHLDTSHDNGIPLALPNVGCTYLDLSGCNLSETDFLVPLLWWSKLECVHLDRNNFVSLPECISKFVNLKRLYLSGCKRLREIPHALPPNLSKLSLDDCTSLEKIPKLPSRLRHMQLANCFGLSGDEVAKLENNLLNLNQESLLCSQLQVMYPGNEIPKRFSYTSKHLTANRIESGREYNGGSEFSFEIPLNLQERETLLGLAFSCVFQPLPLELRRYWLFVEINILCGGRADYKEFQWFGNGMELETDHVGLMLVDLEKKRGDICKVKVHKRTGPRIKICGMHPLFRKEDERLPLSLGPMSSLGSTDIVDDEYDRQQQWPSLSLNPADDHPKRTQIDHNVPSDIEEEQEQPSTISDLLGVWDARFKSCGVHPLLRKEDEWLPLSLGPTSSLGKRPLVHLDPQISSRRNMIGNDNGVL
ncbi:TMV resistance protein N-like [Pyrus ussuriensis x Pyrus communis]|uniref:TMV resistance protein N-like n=1 Tax=Pyrus ussuriensis x Pyrus communis TaxID=2448454 RepID=A0A5N5I314_9ROSA|nr:TMV resistance protein N-like [Pyrus ussuriensis x Pyrus communis]